MKCYLCGGEDHTMVHDSVRFGLPQRPYRCNSCGLVFTHPQISHVKDFYTEGYRDTYNVDDPQKEYDNSLEEAQARVQRFFSRGMLTRNMHILEVGCAYGSFLNEALPHVKYAMGVELSKKCRDYTRLLGLTVVDDLCHVPDGRFNAIFGFHLLEHLPDPIEYLKELKPKLSSSGYVVMEVPNINDVLVSVYKIKEHLDFYYEASHMYYFSKDTLTEVFKRAGFSSLQVFPLQRYDLSNHIYWAIQRRPGGKGYFHDIYGDPLEEKYVEALTLNDMTDTLYMVARK